MQQRLAEVEAAAEGLRQKAVEGEGLRARLADMEASAQHAWQWQEAYTQLQRQLHDVQVRCSGGPGPTPELTGVDRVHAEHAHTRPFPGTWHGHRGRVLCGLCSSRIRLQ